MGQRTATIKHPCVTSHKVLRGVKPYRVVIVVEGPPGDDCASEARVNHWYRFAGPVEVSGCSPSHAPYSLQIRIVYGSEGTTVMLKCG